MTAPTAQDKGYTEKTVPYKVDALHAGRVARQPDARGEARRRWHASIPAVTSTPVPGCRSWPQLGSSAWTTCGRLATRIGSQTALWHKWPTVCAFPAGTGTLLRVSRELVYVTYIRKRHATSDSSVSPSS